MHHLYLVRHGTTQAIEQRRAQGATDSPLSKQGREEARCVSRDLRKIPIDAVFCSPLGRARQTAAIICGMRDLKPVYLDDLREMNFGIYEGHAYIEPPRGGLTRWMKARLMGIMLIAQVSGERIARVKRRAARAWGIITATQPEGKILVVAHGVILNALLSHLLPKNEFQAIQFARLQPCALTELMVPAAGQAHMVRLNDCDHLPKAGHAFS